MGPVQLRRVEDVVMRRTRGEASGMLVTSPAAEDRRGGRVMTEEGPVVDLAAYSVGMDVGSVVDHRVDSRPAPTTWDYLEGECGECGWSSLGSDEPMNAVPGWDGLGSSEQDWDEWIEGGIVAHTGNVRPTLAPATMTMGPAGGARIDVAPSGCVAGPRRRALWPPNERILLGRTHDWWRMSARETERGRRPRTAMGRKANPGWNAPSLWPNRPVRPRWAIRSHALARCLTTTHSSPCDAPEDVAPLDDERNRC